MASFDNIITLFGQPRSGTTILSRLICNHSKVRRIIEPYQTKREINYCESDVVKMCSEFQINEESAISLFVKETTTRVQNIVNMRSLMQESSLKGYRVGYIFVLRSPLEAYLSQVEASETFWKIKTEFGRDPKSLKAFWLTFVQSMEIYLTFAFRFHRRFVFYDQFLDSPVSEIAGLMGFFGYSFENLQMEMPQEDPTFGGDPKARAVTSEFAYKVNRRDDEIAKLGDEFGNMIEFQQMRRMHDYVKDSAKRSNVADDLIRDLTVLVRAMV